MSVSNLYIPNNETIYCKKLFVDDIDISTLEIDNIIVDNATVLTQITTPHINSGTSVFNTVGTINLDAVNGTIGTLDSTTATINTLTSTTATINTLSSTTANIDTINALVVNAQTGNMGTINAQTINGLNITTEALSSQTFTSDSASINDLTVNNSLTVPSLTTPTINCTNMNASNNITVGNTATINTLNVNTTVTAPNVNTNNITAPNGNISGLACSNINTTNITATNANLDTISGTNLTYTNGNIDQANGSNLSYGIGNIGDITGANLYYDVGYIPTLSTKELTIYSSLVSCPNATVDNLTVNNAFNGTDINLSGTMTSANTRTDTINTVSGSGTISIYRPLSLPNILGTSGLGYYTYTAGTLNVTGCFTTTIDYYAVRVGNMITVHVRCFPATTNAVSTNIMILTGFQSQYFPTIGTANGICLVNSGAGPAAGSYKFLTSGQLNIYGNTAFGNFFAGLPCGLAGSATEYASFNFITNN